MMAENEEDTLGGIMERNPVTIKPDASVRKALQLMIKKDVGSLIVVKNGEPLGIITERDVTRLSLRLAQAVYERPVTRLMTHPLITLPPTTPVWEALETMLAKKIRRVPIVDQGRLAGIVTERDLFKWAIRVLYEPRIPNRIKKLLE